MRVEWHRRNKDGSLHWDEVYLRAAEIAGEKRIVAFTREITERRRAEEAPRASEEQYRAIFNSSVDGLALCAFDGRVVDANPAFCRLHGYAREELLAAESFQFLHPDSHVRCWAFFEAVSQGRPIRTEARAQRRDGSTFDAEIHGVHVHYQGRPHLFVITRDITECKQAEAAQKMEAIGHLSGGIAHDFNNILTTVMGYIAMAQERVAGAADEKLERYLERALRSGRQARDLIQQLLTFSRGQRGAPRPLALAPLVNESVKLLRSTLSSSIEFETAIASALPAVLLDPVQIDQVLMNLCINARDAMDGSGVLRVTLARVRHEAAVCSSCRQPVAGEFVELAVGDTGCGIEPEVIDRMFEPFFTTKEPGKGSGMGLSTVHGIVHEHGGHVLVETAPGAGATFRVLFRPMPESAQAGPGAGRAAEPGAASWRLKGRVLVVDDSRRSRSSCRSCSRARGSTSRSAPVRSRPARCSPGSPIASTSS